MERKTKSAPPGGAQHRAVWSPSSKSKFLQGKTDAAKEVEAWAMSGRTATCSMDTSRQSGQLNDIVTEQRMYHSRLMDLSKARYRFITQNSYEKRLFVERQQRKGPVFRELLKDVPLRRGASLKGWSGLNKQSASRISNARLAMLDRFDPCRSLDRPKDVYEEDQDQDEPTKTESKAPGHVARPKTVHFSEQREAALPPSPTKTAPPGISVSTHCTPQQPNNHEDSSLPRIPQNIWKKIQQQQPSESHASSPQLLAWADKKTKRRSSSAKPVGDPRYRSLERCLSSVYEAQPGGVTDLPLVIKTNASLHLPPKKPKDSNSHRLHWRIKQFMLEKGILIK